MRRKEYTPQFQTFFGEQYSPRSRLAWIKSRNGGRLSRESVRRYSVNGRDFYSYRGHESSGRWDADYTGNAKYRPFYTSALPAGVRYVGAQGDLSERGNATQGYYCDAYCDNVAFGFVCQWPARDGSPRYFPGVAFTDACGLTLYPAEVYDNPQDARRAAEGYAEYTAEEWREDDATQRAEQDIEEARESIKGARATVRALVADLRTAGTLPGAICGAVRAAVQREREAVADALATIKARRANYWSAVENY